MYGLKWGWIRWLRVIWWSGIVVMPFSCILFWYPSAVNWGQCKSVVNRSSFNLSKWRRRCLNGPRKEKRIPAREKTLFHIIIFGPIIIIILVFWKPVNFTGYMTPFDPDILILIWPIYHETSWTQIKRVKMIWHEVGTCPRCSSDRLRSRALILTEAIW